jgi:uncharacterized membrane protein
VSGKGRPGNPQDGARLRQKIANLPRKARPAKRDANGSLRKDRKDAAPNGRDRRDTAGEPRNRSDNGADGRGRKDAGRRDAVRRKTAGRRPGLDTPLDARWVRGPVVDSETFGRWSETFARFMGTAWFLVGMTVFVGAWLAWNAFAPDDLQFDPRRLNFTLMTLILSLQASYAAPLILLAQNRQADRDRVTAEQDRDRAERALADTEYLAREVAALRIALGEVATRDFVRSELRSLLDELQPKGPEGAQLRKPARKPADSFGSTREVDLPTE